MAVSAQADAAADRPRRVPEWQVGVVFYGLVLAIVGLRASGLADAPVVATFALVFASIAVEALPFVLLGAAVSAAVAAFVPDRFFERVGRLPRRLQVPAAAACALAFPVCECGSVPVGRRLILRGVHPTAALVFTFAAPVINPVVLASTWVAYGGGARGEQMLAGRALLGLAIAVAAASAVTRGGRNPLRDRPGAEGGHGHDHGSRWATFADHLVGDFLFMGRFIVLGAALSALLQTAVPQDLATGLAHTPVVGTLVMMALAFALSLCSEADAFVAASFVAFPIHAQLAFLALGPVVDLKLAVLYGATFRRGFLPRLLLAAIPVCVIGAELLGVLR